MHLPTRVTPSQPLQSTYKPHNPTTPVQDVQEKREAYTFPAGEKEKLTQLTDSLNDIFQSLQTSLRFRFHDKLGEYYVTVVNNETDEVIKEIPPKKMLDLYASIAESIGIIVDHKI
ncbi:flagellar protein FlaG [Halobacillus sp. Cin3]|uniref:flagellar protein FlaG n=1 Tax=Halobacillus sp. Cin3 TaxID=2928441 RepID=UPI00248E729F|nr:flagellar protein FlaG [Halobacillus sp. Cin3]